MQTNAIFHENVNSRIPPSRMAILHEPIVSFDNNNIYGLSIYFPTYGHLNAINGSFIHLNYELYCIFVFQDIERNNEIENKIRKKFSSFFFNPNVEAYDTYNIDELFLNRFLSFVEEEKKSFENVHKKETLQIILKNDFFNKDNETTTNNVNTTTEEDNKPKITIWDYPGFENDCLEPSPWRAFASHTDTVENGGFCMGQWDGFYSKIALENGTPYGIIPGNGNKKKFEDLLKHNIITNSHPLYEFIQNLLNAGNSYERINVLKNYLESIGKKYDDESYCVKEENGTEIKKSFFSVEIFPLFLKLRSINNRRPVNKSY